MHAASWHTQVTPFAHNATHHDQELAMHYRQASTSGKTVQMLPALSRFRPAAYGGTLY